jgi:lysophospholipid acyltransferase (LPLAT)-like uncharacterized protein
MDFQAIAGRLIARYFHAVWATSNVAIYPQDALITLKKMTPCIMAAWHGQRFITPFALPSEEGFRVLLANGVFGSIYAHMCTQLGLNVIRGSAGSPRDMHRNGGYSAYRQMLEALNANDSIAITADIPKVARRAGPGIIALARHSGRPIIPLAAVTTGRLILTYRWDKTSINLPYSCAAVVFGGPVLVNNIKDRPYLETKRKELEDGLNTADALAHTLLAQRHTARRI